jgi:hypothetical protein
MVAAEVSGSRGAVRPGKRAVLAGAKGNMTHWNRPAPALALTLTLLSLAAPAMGMEIRTEGDQLILSGPVIGDEFDRVQDALAASPAIKTIILRNSPGGDAPTGYRVGALFRERSLHTAVSGYCYSSCSRMFLGGSVRQFTNDYPPEFTEVGFHGHYGKDGKLNSAYVARMGLAAWIEKYSDGKADPALVERWINIPTSRGMMHFYHPDLAKTHGAATFMCQGTEGGSVFDCESFKRTALDLGVITSTDLMASNDQAALRATVPARIVPSGWGSLTDIDKVPLKSDTGREAYKRFLKAPLPRSFAISPDGKHGAWNSGGSYALPASLSRCHQLSGSACSLYAVDNDVVWKPATQPRSAPGTQ